jgi:hypothetical protein
VKLTTDKLGFIVIDPACSECSIDLEFAGGRERKIALGVSVFGLLGLLAMLL